jgi:transcriptional regulator with XRE-family HTH domain
MNSLLNELGGGSNGGSSIPASISAPSNHYSTGITSNIEERAMSLLGAGIKQEAVASALGVSPSRITQLLSDETFAAGVSKLRYDALQNHSIRDAKYDSLEDKLLVKLENSLPLMVKPESILKALSVVNGAKRRGLDSPDASGATTNIVNLMLPTVIAEKFTVNIDNQVTRAGSQDLHTMTSGNLMKQVEAAETNRLAIASARAIELLRQL